MDAIIQNKTHIDPTNLANSTYGHYAKTSHTKANKQLKNSIQKKSLPSYQDENIHVLFFDSIFSLN